MIHITAITLQFKLIKTHYINGKNSFKLLTVTKTVKIKP